MYVSVGPLIQSKIKIKMIQPIFKFSQMFCWYWQTVAKSHKYQILVALLLTWSTRPQINVDQELSISKFHQNSLVHLIVHINWSNVDINENNNCQLFSYSIWVSFIFKFCFRFHLIMQQLIYQRCSNSNGIHMKSNQMQWLSIQNWWLLHLRFYEFFRFYYFHCLAL